MPRYKISQMYDNGEGIYFTGQAFNANDSLTKWAVSRGYQCFAGMAIDLGYTKSELIITEIKERDEG
jgi:hypothetical protein